MQLDGDYRVVDVMWGPAFSLLALLCCLMFLAGCESPDVQAPVPQIGVAREPLIRKDEVAGVASTEISVLIYNVAGLPWPISRNKRSRTLDEAGNRTPISSRRPAVMQKIGDLLGAMRERGEAPDIVLLQEGFIREVVEIPLRGGYPNWVAGPSASELGAEHSSGVTDAFLQERSFWKGEKLGKLQSSGILVASNFPIIRHENFPFYQWECAGFDCLANKGVTLVWVEIPGVPDLLQVATTHFNSRGASGVSGERSRVAHALQVDAASDFLEGTASFELPEIWGGDLNMRHADDRVDYFIKRNAGALAEVSSFCVDPENDCDVRIEWETDAPWYETQDLQGWFSGARVDVQPVAVEALFNEPREGLMLSDHDGLLVRYRLSWALALSR